MISGRQLLWLKGDCWELFRGGDIVGMNSVGKVLNKLQGKVYSRLNYQNAYEKIDSDRLSNLLTVG